MASERLSKLQKVILMLVEEHWNYTKKYRKTEMRKNWNWFYPLRDWGGYRGTAPFKGLKGEVEKHLYGNGLRYGHGDNKFDVSFSRSIRSLINKQYLAFLWADQEGGHIWGVCPNLDGDKWDNVKLKFNIKKGSA